MRFVLAILVVVCGFVFSVANAEVVTFNGETFPKKAVSQSPTGEKLIEFVRENETFDKWTKLLAYRYYPAAANNTDPVKAATIMAQIVNTKNKNTKAVPRANPTKDNAILNFYQWPADKSFTEFNMMRFTKSEDGKAVISLQIAFRLPYVAPEDVETTIVLSPSVGNSLVTYDMKRVSAALAE
jgi:hypothetical protein